MGARYPFGATLFNSTAVLRVRDGLIAQAWDEMDSGAILKTARLAILRRGEL